MIKTLQNGDRVNTIYNVLDKIIVKKYLSYDRLTRDIEGSRLWYESFKGSVPKKYFQTRKTVFWEFLNLESNPKSKSIIKNFAKLYSNIVKKSNNTGMYKSWQKYFTDIVRLYDQDKSDIQTLIGRKNFQILEKNILELRNLDWTYYKLIPLHRDLHIGNIFYDSSKNIKIIDFEHHCIGPIEFEFCNAIFWNDEYSLNFKFICNELYSHKISVNQTLSYKLTLFYFVEQYYLAKIQSDNKKLKLLADKVKIFFQNYLQYLECDLGVDYDISEAKLAKVANNLIHFVTF